jgi:serine/threonine-protein kinase
VAQAAEASPAPEAKAAPTGATLGGRYQVLRLHAKGNLGVVYLARDAEFDREVALKQIQQKHADRPLSRSLFEVEARVTGGLEHPGIVPVYSLGTDATGQPFYTMRFIRGVSLRQAIRRFFEDQSMRQDASARNLAERALLRRFEAACYAVAYAHSRGVVHRDLKPSNIMLGDYGETIVVDWGLAKPLGHASDAEISSEEPLRASSGSGSAEFTTPGVKGTPAYMSPEQARGQPATPASDIYSLGATLYTLLCGQPPFVGRDTPAVLQGVRAGTFPRPRRIRRDVPQALEAVCLKAMHMQPKDRFGSARELAAEVERWLSDEPVRSYREPWTVRAARWARRHRTVVAALVAVLTVLAAASVPLTILYQQRTAALRQAELAEADAKTSAQRAELARDLAQRNFLQTRALVVRNLAEMADHVAYLPWTEKLRQGLVDSAVAHYVNFLNLHRDDPTLMAEGARVFRIAANVGRLLETRPKETSTLYNQAIDLAERLVNRSPSRARQRFLARLFVDRAEWRLVQGLIPEARKDLEAALDRLPAEPPKGDDPEAANDRQVEAILWLDLAAASSEMAQTAQATQNVRKAAEMFDSLPEPARSNWINRLLRVKALTSRASLALQQGDRNQAVQSLTRAEQDAFALAKEQPTNVDILLARAAIEQEHARLLAADPDSLPQRLSLLTSALDLLRDVYAHHPSVPSHRRALSFALVELAELHREAGALRDAQATCDEALNLSDPKPDGHPPTQEDHAATAAALAMRGRIARARGESAEARRWSEQAIARYEQVLKVAPTRAAIRALRDALRSELDDQ